MSKVWEVRDAGWRRLAELHRDTENGKPRKEKHELQYFANADQPESSSPVVAICPTCKIEWSAGNVLHKRRVQVDGL